MLFSSKTCCKSCFTSLKLVKKPSSQEVKQLWYFKHDVRKSRENVFLLKLFRYSIYFFNFCFKGRFPDSCHPPAQEYIQPIKHPKQPMNISHQLQAEEEYEYRCHSDVKISPTLLLYCHKDATHSLNGSRLKRRAVYL